MQANLLLRKPKYKYYINSPRVITNTIIVKDTYKSDLQKRLGTHTHREYSMENRLVKETYKRDLHKRFTKETYKRDWGHTHIESIRWKRDL